MDQVGYDGESAVCFGYLKSLDAMNTTDFISFYILNDIKTCYLFVATTETNKF